MKIDQLICPNCQQALSPSTHCCPQGHCFGSDENGVLSLFTEEVRAEFLPFAKAVSEKRQKGGLPFIDPTIYNSLPCSPGLQHNKEWQWRCYDLSIVRESLSHLPDNSPKTILDVGAYNGWLSHNLAADGHQVTAVDYFTDEFDGLGAIKHYRHSWQPIQIDLTDLSPLNIQFDIVIMNHGLQFFPDPAAHLQQLLTIVKTGGLLIIIGLIIYRNPILRIRYLARARQEHLEEYGRPLLFRPARGYLDHSDKTKIKQLGIARHPYPQFRAVNFLSRIVPIIPWRGYGLGRV